MSNFILFPSGKRLPNCIYQYLAAKVNIQKKLTALLFPLPERRTMASTGVYEEKIKCTYIAKDVNYTQE